MLDLSAEILDTLPAASRLKLERLASDRDAARAAYRAASDREQEARIELGRVDGLARRQLEAHPGFETTYPGAAAPKPSTATQERLSAPVEAAKRALQVAVDARERAAERQNAFGFLENVEAWLRRTATPGVSFREAKVDPALVKVRGDIAAEVAKARARIAEAEEALTKAENAPAPAADLKARAFAEVDAIADAGKPTVYTTTRGSSPINLKRQLELSAHATGGDASGVSIRGNAGANFFVWLMRDEIRQRIGAMIDAAPQAGVMSDDEREQAFRQIAEQRLELERIEEHLIATAEVDGRHIARRADADPRAVLGIEA